MMIEWVPVEECAGLFGKCRMAAPGILQSMHGNRRMEKWS